MTEYTLKAGRGGDQIYISPKLSRRLYWLRELERFRMEDRIITREDVADKLLNEKIEQDYPNIAALEKRRDALDNQLLSELENPLVKPVKPK